MSPIEPSRRTYGLPVSERPGLVVFYLAFGIYVVYASIMSTRFWEHRDVLMLGAVDPLVAAKWIIWSLLALKLLLQRYTPLQAFTAGLLCVTALLSWHYSAHLRLVPDALFFIAAGQNVKIRKLAQIALPITAAMFCITLIGHFSGLLENITIGSDFSDNSTGRNSLGFLHPNTLGRFIFQMVVGWLVSRYEKMDWWNAGVVLGGALATWLVTESQTFTFAILLAGLVHVLSVQIRSQRLLAACALAGTVGIIGFTLIALVAFDPAVRFWERANALVTGRLTLAHWYWVTHPATLFGQTFDDTVISWYPSANGALIVDNAYDHIILRYGLVAAAILIGATIAVFVKAVRESTWNAALFGLVLYVVVGFAENAFYMFDANYFLIAAAPLLYSRPLNTLEAP